MSTTAISSVSSATGTNVSTVASRLPVQTLGQDDFLKLLVAQLSAQDPMNPQKDTEFIAQMAQFSALEQTRSMQSDIAGLRSEQQFLQANGMIGRTVSLQDSSGATITGVVSGLSLATGTPQIMVNGKAYALSSLLGVTAPPASN
jgi:flagellar basal-body rod modification protein FlgD